MFFNKKKFKNGIVVYYNVLSERERMEILLLSKRYLKKLGFNFPGLQTESYMHNIFDKKILLKICRKVKEYNIDKCWVNYTDKNLKYRSWHTHQNSKMTVVYMLENPEKKGTIFDLNGEIVQINCPTNSIISIPSNILHTVPDNIKESRYSLTIDFI